ncbi:hypothetical protein NL676_025865 [Syzygium grande]|nr:hypothetical protein NL676_025865 [Syzygium grande]
MPDPDRDPDSMVARGSASGTRLSAGRRLNAWRRGRHRPPPLSPGEASTKARLSNEPAPARHHLAQPPSPDERIAQPVTQNAVSHSPFGDNNQAPTPKQTTPREINACKSDLILHNAKHLAAR